MHLRASQSSPSGFSLGRLISPRFLWIGHLEMGDVQGVRVY